jgi:DNA-binding MarR family transcriptional regulator
MANIWSDSREALDVDLLQGCYRKGEDPIEAVLPVGYDGEIVGDVFHVLRLLKERRPIYYTDIAAELKIDTKYVHLILEVLADRNFTEYGTSPRGSWLTPKGERLLEMATVYRAI